MKSSSPPPCTNEDAPSGCLKKAVQWRRTERQFAWVMPDGSVTCSGTEDTLPSSAPWFAKPPTVPVTQVAIIGGGLAGATTASALAQLGIACTIFEQNNPANAASGNRYGLLYAKISPHDTAQTRLLDMGYGYSRQLLERVSEDIFLPCGVLHHDYDADEMRRNRLLAATHPQQSLFRYIDEKEARAVSGISLNGGGLWWPHGGRVAPARWVTMLIDHPLIRLRNQTRVHAISRCQNGWRTDADDAVFSHIVLCTGAQAMPEPLGCLKMRTVRGQTTVMTTNQSKPLCAISGRHYVCPPSDGHLVFGASFIPNDPDTALRISEHHDNINGIRAIHPELANGLSGSPEGHAALRCDTFDHLPVVGAIANPTAFENTYQKLATDAKYPIDTPCPWLEGIYLNTAHGSRGLSTIPLCSQHIAHNIAGLPDVLDNFLKRALHPNRILLHQLTRQPKTKKHE